MEQKKPEDMTEEELLAEIREDPCGNHYPLANHYLCRPMASHKSFFYTGMAFALVTIFSALIPKHPRIGILVPCAIATVAFGIFSLFSYLTYKSNFTKWFAQRRNILISTVRDARTERALSQHAKTSVPPILKKLLAGEYSAEENFMEGGVYRPYRVEYSIPRSIRHAIEWEDLAYPELDERCVLLFLRNAEGRTIRALIPDTQTVLDELYRIVKTSSPGNHIVSQLCESDEVRLFLSKAYASASTIDRLASSVDVDTAFDHRPAICIRGIACNSGNLIICTGMTVNEKEVTFIPTAFFSALKNALRLPSSDPAEEDVNAVVSQPQDCVAS